VSGRERARQRKRATRNTDQTPNANMAILSMVKKRVVNAAQPKRRGEMPQMI
jgi:hypothetical protein